MSYISDYKYGYTTDDEYRFHSIRDRDEDTECCGNCQYHKVVNNDFCCMNKYSDYYGDYTEYRDGCIDYEPR